jgi:hypothetical protein
MVCCAKTVCRNQTNTTGTCHLALFGNKTAASNADVYVSNACPLTFIPATGVLSTKCICACSDSYHAQLITPSGSTRYITLKLSNANDWNEFTSNVDIYVFDNHINFSIKVSDGIVSINEISKTTDYGINKYLLGDYDSTNTTITIYFRFSGYREANIVSSTPIVEASASTTAPTGTFVDIPLADRTNYVGLASANAEYPLVFSTCCATPASSFKTLYNDTANNLMYNSSSNTLITSCIRGNTAIIAGNPTVCTSSQTGNSGTGVCSGYMEMFASTPFIDFHTNNAGAGCSHRIIANNGYLRVTSTNATGCTAATQTANFDFCSNGTLKATCFDGNATCFGGCTYAQAKTDILSGNAANATCFNGCTYAQAKADIAGSVETTPFTCINDVNAGAQDILMTSSTGTLGIVNASTGTNACPLKYNPATGALCVPSLNSQQLQYNYITADDCCIHHLINMGESCISLCTNLRIGTVFNDTMNLQMFPTGIFVSRSIIGCPTYTFMCILPRCIELHQNYQYNSCICVEYEAIKGHYRTLGIHACPTALVCDIYKLLDARLNTCKTVSNPTGTSQPEWRKVIASGVNNESIICDLMFHSTCMQLVYTDNTSHTYLGTDTSQWDIAAGAIGLFLEVTGVSK